MAKFEVNLITYANCTVVVEAEDSDDAVNLAFEKELPHTNIHNDFDLGHWELECDVLYNVAFEDTVRQID